MYASPYAGRLGPRSQLAYGALKQRLLRGEFPLTQRLGEEALAAELGVSRTPVHEALTRLHAERLVERNPQGGFYPAAPDLVEVRELYEVRRALEADAIVRPARTGEPHDRDELLALRDDWQVLGPPEGAEAGGPGADGAGADPEFVLLDEEFHVRLAHAAGNASLAELLVQVNERIRPVRTQDFLTAGRIATTVEQHLGVIGALLAGDERLAARLLGSHIAESMDVVEQRVATAFARMSTRSDPRRSRPSGGAGGQARPRPPASRRRR
jgi:DNA-binding GntR family transcriptional regulator